MFLIVAHRGYSGKYPENTIPSFEAAVKTEADFVELDVRRTRDKRLVVIHDKNLKRLFGSNEDVGNLTYDKLRRYVLKKNGVESSVPLLEDALNVLANSNKSVIVELKESGYEASVYNMVKKSGLNERVIFASFNFSILRKMRNIAPNIPVLPISNTFTEKILNYAVILGAGMIALRKDAVSRDVVVKCAKKGIAVNAWIVNDFKDAVKYLKMGVKILSTDFPAEMSKLRKTILKQLNEILDNLVIEQI